MSSCGATGRVFVIGALVLGCALAQATVTRADTVAVPPALGGERLDVNGDESLADPNALRMTSYSCDPTGARATYQAYGLAEGPYPGTFAEQATIVLGAPAADGVRPILAFDVTFTIDSPVGRVSGTKTLDRTITPEPWQALTAQCTPEDPRGFWIESFYAISPQLRYLASIETPDGTFIDYGIAWSVFRTIELLSEGVPWDEMAEEFFVDEESPEPAPPEAVQDCKDERWRLLNFRNQGLCVSSVVSAQRDA